MDTTYLLLALFSLAYGSEDLLLSRMRVMQVPSIDAINFYKTESHPNHRLVLKRSPSESRLKRGVKFGDEESKAEAISASIGVGLQGLTASLSSAQADGNKKYFSPHTGLGGYPGGYGQYGQYGQYGGGYGGIGGGYPNGYGGYPSNLNQGHGVSSSSASAASSSSNNFGGGGGGYPIGHSQFGLNQPVVGVLGVNPNSYGHGYYPGGGNPHGYYPQQYYNQGIGGGGYYPGFIGGGPYPYPPPGFHGYGGFRNSNQTQTETIPKQQDNNKSKVSFQDN